MDRPERFSREVADVLSRSGWFPGRRVDVSQWSDVLDETDQPDGFRLPSTARAALEEFGGLSIRQRGPGVDYARPSVTFDPLSASGEEDRFDEWSKRIESRLYPLGEDLYGTYWMAMDEQGRVFLVGPELHYAGPDMDAAIENLVLGRRPADFFTVTSEAEP
jgi:hypothetical protein